MVINASFYLEIRFRTVLFLYGSAVSESEPRRGGGPCRAPSSREVSRMKLRVAPGPAVPRFLFAVLACAFMTTPVRPQTAAEVEKHIANLPAEQRAYERFRFWLTSLPPDEQKDSRVKARYREYLVAHGFSEADADGQLKLIDEQGERAEVERWNRILTSDKPGFNTHPNGFLIEIAKARKPGTALDVGMGQGRNSIWLAQQGWDVTGFDPAEKAVTLAQENARKLGVRLNAQIKRSEDFDFGESRWDLILLSYAGGREMPAALEKALKPGGVLVIEAFHRDATKLGPIGGAVVFDTGELPALYPQLRVVRYEEPVAIADFGLEKMRLVRYCAERPK
jgi:2-polyprenyl-3-methyl-5-hydroxy-6-metoxy-1,4-benzoquinol methylase